MGSSSHPPTSAARSFSFLAFSFSAFQLFSFCLVGCSTTPLTHGIPNFVQVAPGIYRGGQPTSESWPFLRSLGATNIIKLNPGPETAPPDFIIHIFPITPIQQLLGPVAPQLEAALPEIRPGTFIHCRKGANRTGTLVILYRERICHWPKSAALAEANRYGWRSSWPALKRYIALQP